jgi:hypothetical protein
MLFKEHMNPPKEKTEGMKKTKRDNQRIFIKLGQTLVVPCSYA